MYYAELNVPKNHVYLFKPHFQTTVTDLARMAATITKSVVYCPPCGNGGTFRRDVTTWRVGWRTTCSPWARKIIRYESG